MCLLLSSSPRVVAGEAPEGLPLVFFEDFESGDVSRWAAGDPAAWRLDVRDGRRVFSLHRLSDVQTPVRQPFGRAVRRGVVVGDFQLDADVLSTGRDHAHRSICLYFGYQDPLRFYYVHLGRQTDEVSNQIHIVNEAPRTRISTKTSAGTPWDDGWHHVRVRRRVGDGSIEVYFDDMDEPVMTATDATFTWGAVGIGSFGDTGDFDTVRLHGIVVERPPR